MERSFEYPELGHVTVKENVRARSVTMHVRPDGLRVTVPAGTSHKDVVQVIASHFLQLSQRLRVLARPPIDLNFKIEAPFLSLSIEQGTREGYYLRRKGREIRIICPPEADLSTSGQQDWLHSVIVKVMQQQAKRILPHRLYMLAQEHGFEYKALHIQNSQTRWGSCSTAKSINLSLYLLLLPEHLADYVMLHELCHTREMNHSEHFWHLLDKMTTGRAKTLREELKQYHPYI